MKEDIIRGSGNVYQDLNIPDADVRQFKAILAADFSRIRTADLARFTSDRLMMILNKLGSRLEVSVKVKERKREAVHA